VTSFHRSPARRRKRTIILAIPVISNLNNPQQQQAWQRALNRAVKKPLTCAPPSNFTVTSKQGGNYLQWAAMRRPGNEADGYRVEISTTGDFSTGVTSVTLKGNANTAYFDNVPTAQGATPAKRFYRVSATTGTQSEPQSVVGKPSGVIASTAISPDDKVTASQSAVDTTVLPSGGSPYHGSNRFNLT
jgi:hypothetical protein